MAKKKDKEWTKEERISMLKSIGKGLVEILKQPVPGYMLSSLTLLALGKARLLPCGIVGTLQGVNTYLAISQQVEEGDLGFLETAAKGGTAVTIGALWAQEVGKSKKECVIVGEGGIVPTPVSPFEPLPGPLPPFDPLLILTGFERPGWLIPR